MSTQATLPLLQTLPRSAPDAAASAPPRPDAVAFARHLRHLRRAAARGGPLVLGSPDAPYRPDGPSPLAALLEVLEGMDGLDIAVVTDTPAILGELGLLARLDRRHTVRVDMLVPAADPYLARWIEPGGADPRQRPPEITAVAALAAEGIATRVLCAPRRAGRPGGSGSEALLRPLFAAAQAAGAWDVGVPALASPGAPAGRLGRLLAGLAARQREQDAPLLAVCRRLRLEYGFPRPLPGRG